MNTNEHESIGHRIGREVWEAFERDLKHRDREFARQFVVLDSNRLARERQVSKWRLKKRERRLHERLKQ
jgi:hypothetical protein